MTLVLQAALFRPFRRVSFHSLFGRAGCLPDQRFEAPQSHLAVALLRARLARLDDEDSLLRHTPARKLDQAFADRVRQRRRVSDVETQLHRRRHFINILTPRPRCANEVELQFAFIYRDRVGYPNQRTLLFICSRQHAACGVPGLEDVLYFPNQALVVILVLFIFGQFIDRIPLA
jgi:hypothetical protein